ncbi:MAG: DUF4013 domain-containing protein [Anaerolineaceae bacterium]|nr:DUF4013 domain-containing protein [Anaerolineaceae bacterium]
MVNFRKALTFIFDDENWFDKLIVPLLVSLIPVIGQFVILGYILRTIANVHQNEINPLPTFDFGEDLSRGFRYTLINLVYSLPAIVLAILFILPINIIDNASNTGTEVFGIMMILLIVLLFFVYALALFLIQPIAMANFAVKNTFASGFEFGNFFKRLRTDFKAWLLVYAGSILAGLIAPLGSIVFFIGVVVTTFYGQLLVAHLCGQAMTATD